MFNIALYSHICIINIIMKLKFKQLLLCTIMSMYTLEYELCDYCCCVVNELSVYVEIV